MRSPCDPPKFDEKDWSQFDSGWHADGVSEEETDNAVADLAAKFFQSDEGARTSDRSCRKSKQQCARLTRPRSGHCARMGRPLSRSLTCALKRLRSGPSGSRGKAKALTVPLMIAAQPDTFQLGRSANRGKVEARAPGYHRADDGSP